MIKSFYMAGKLLSQVDDFKDYFRPWANPFPNWQGLANVVIAEVVNGCLEPKLTIESFSVDKVDKYLFREARANATNLVPTFYLHTQTSVEKQNESIRTMVKKIRQSVKNYQHDFLTDAQIDEIELKLRQLSLDQGTKYLFTIRIDGLYFGDYEPYRSLFLNDKTPYATYWRKSWATGKVCAVQYEQVPEVWGRVNTLGFTVEKPAFSLNGFNGADSYKMFPVSPDAVKTLEGAKRLMLERLSRSFFGLNYLIMPRFIQAVSSETATQFWNDYLTSTSEDGETRDCAIRAFIEGNSPTCAQQINKLDNCQSVAYTLFFYEENQAQFAIKLSVADILPVRFHQLFQLKNAVDSAYEALTDSQFTATGKSQKFGISLAAIKDYFADEIILQGKTKWRFHPSFYRVIEAIFYNQPLDQEQLLRAFVTTIRASFRDRNQDPYQANRHTRHTFVLLQFFYQLNLFSYSNMKPTPPQPLALMPEAFEKQHPDMLTHPLRRAAFYLGCEVEILLAKQKSFYRSQPFRQCLNGLNLDVDQLRKIHLKLTAKIGEYTDTSLQDKRHFYSSELARIAELDAHIGPALLLADNSLSKADISYAFAVGMAMQKAFTNEQIRQIRSKRMAATNSATAD
ncbi:hypothetical protein GCM10028805_14440 [Spirosoma harenae]